MSETLEHTFPKTILEQVRQQQGELRINNQTTGQRIKLVGVELLLDDTIGTREFRTAMIAERAHTTESTLFRYVQKPAIPTLMARSIAALQHEYIAPRQNHLLVVATRLAMQAELNYNDRLQAWGKTYADIANPSAAMSVALIAGRDRAWGLIKQQYDSLEDCVGVLNLSEGTSMPKGFGMAAWPMLEAADAAEWPLNVGAAVASMLQLVN